MANWLQAASGWLAARLPFARPEGGVDERELYLSSVRIGPRQHVVLMIDRDGNEVGRLPLAGRGHDIAVCADRGLAVVFARRPGYFALVVDTSSKAALATIRPPEGHHFFGHGTFSADGSLLYATENDFGSGAPRGVIGVYRADGDFPRIGEFETGGLDAHEILLGPDGRTLVVANGGIETHPDFGRQKLNLGEMRPSIVRLDSATGDRLDETVLPQSLNRLSMRHMSFDGDGNLWFGCQWEGARGMRPPLVGRIARDGAVRLLDFPDGVAPLARNYIGSVVASRDGSLVATSSPIGGTLFLWDTAMLALKRTVAFRDGCGLAGATGHHFLATSGDGLLVDLTAEAEPRTLARRAVHFDNHLRRLG